MRNQCIIYIFCRGFVKRESGLLRKHEITAINIIALMEKIYLKLLTIRYYLSNKNYCICEEATFRDPNGDSRAIRILI